MQQVFVIHGGDTHESHDAYLAALKAKTVSADDLHRKGDWKQNLETDLGAGYEVIMPRMPSKENARYEEWEIWFEKYLPFMKAGAMLVGHSLGGIFLTKYLSGHTLPVSARALFLVAASHDGVGGKHVTWSTFHLPSDLNNVARQMEDIFLYHSREDEMVPFSDFEKYQKELPSAHPHPFDGRGHFNAETFPEIVADIKSLA